MAILGYYCFFSGDNLVSSDYKFSQYKNKIGGNKMKTKTDLWKISCNLTRSCNLHCLTCFSDAKKNQDNDELTADEYADVFRQMNEMGTRKITLGGGEPLTKPDLFEIVRSGVKNNIDVSIVSNLTLVDKQMAKELNALHLEAVIGSFDGLEENHEFIRGKGNFEKSVRAVELLKRYCKTAKIGMRMTVTSKNYTDCLEVINLAEKLQVDFIRLTPMLLCGRANKFKWLLLNQDQYIVFLLAVKSYPHHIQVITPFQEENTANWVNPDNFGCHCGKTACWLLQNGDVTPCIFFGDNHLAGNVRNTSLRELWERSKELSVMTGNPICKSCPSYKKCETGCRARALWEYGDINAVDPLCPLRRNKSL